LIIEQNFYHNLKPYKKERPQIIQGEFGARRAIFQHIA